VAGIVASGVFSRFPRRLGRGISDVIDPACQEVADREVHEIWVLDRGGV
jgi:hypothetical protein